MRRILRGGAILFGRDSAHYLVLDVFPEPVSATPGWVRKTQILDSIWEKSPLQGLTPVLSSPKAS